MKEPQKPTSAQLVREELRAETPIFLRDALFVGLGLFVLCASSILLIYLTAVTSESADRRASLLKRAKYLASEIDPEPHARLQVGERAISSTFHVLTDRLQHARRLFPAITELFTGRLEKGTVRVILDTHPPTQLPGTGQTIGRTLPVHLEVDGPEWRAISSRQATLIERSVLGRGGEGAFSVIAPIEDSPSQAPEFLYIESTGAQFLTNQPAFQAAFWLSLGGAACVGLFAGLATYILRRRSRFRQELAVVRLRESEELFRSTYSLSPVPMFLATTEGRLLRANRAFCEFIGYSEFELLKLTIEALSHPQDFADEQDLLRQLRHHQTAKYGVEKRYRRKDGIWVTGLTGVAVVRNSDGVSSHFMVQVVDITTRKRGEEILRQSQDRLALATEAGGVGVWECDLTTGKMIWNDVMHEVFQTDRQSFSPTLEAQLSRVYPKDRPAVEELFRQCAQHGGLYQNEHRIVVNNGQTRFVTTRALVSRDERGRPARAIGTTIDVTAEKEEKWELLRAKDAALAADRAKSEFLAVMSHEIRTPLNGVLGFASLLKHTPLNAEQESFVGTMESSGEHLLTLVNDILDLSKIESGEISLEQSTRDVRPLIEDIHRRLEARALQKKLKYEFVFEDGVPTQIHTDPARLNQILTNLLGNAIKFTDAGQVGLRVSAQRAKDDQWKWRFSVSDTGPGIPPEAAEHLSRLFYQVDSSSTRKHGGSGMGLAISCRLASLLGGQISVRSKLGEGSEFTLEMVTTDPPKTPPEPAPPADQSLSKEAEARIRGKHVLVVEDNSVNRKLCALQLKRLGCVTDFAITGREAVEKVAAAQFDLVLMDMQLPDLDGCDATREIRQKERDGKRLPIIALTANAMADDRKKCFDAGMDDFLAKPLRVEALAAMLAKWMEE